MRLDDPAPAVRRRGRLPVPAVRQAHAARPRGHRRLVRLGLHALRAVARAVRERRALRAALPGRLHLRGARPDARLVLLAAGGLDAAVRPLELRERRLPRADGRRRGPEDVEVQGQRRGALGGHRRATAPTPCAGTSSPPSTPGTATGSAPRRWASRSGCSSSSYGTPTATSTIYEVERDGEPTDLDRWALSRTAGDRRAGHRAARRLRRDDRRPRDRRARRRPVQLVLAALAPAILGGRQRGVRHAARRACSTVAKLLAPFCPFVADEIYDNLDGELASVHLCDWPEAGERDVALELAMATAREAVRLGLRGARAGQGQAAPAAARGGCRRGRSRARGDRAPGGRGA